MNSIDMPCMSNVQYGSGTLVHIVLDSVFIDIAIREYEAVAPGASRWVILGEKRELRYVKSNAIIFLSIAEAESLIRSPDCRAVIMHTLSVGLVLLRNFPSDKKLIWIGWGSDYYQRLLAKAFPDGLLLTKTKLLVGQKPKDSLLKLILPTLKRLVRSVTDGPMRFAPSMLERIDIFSPVLDIEYNIACKLNPWFKAKYMTWNYGTLEEDLVLSNQSDLPLGRNILVGNSSTPENNHLDVFHYLKKCTDYSDRMIVTPLSYGDGWYRNEIIRIGYDMFGSQFLPLTEFLDKQRYIDLLQSCGHVFMGHLRQQALGNICIMMLKGAKIYLNSSNPIYAWLQCRGGVVQAFDCVYECPGPTLLTALSSDDQSTNIGIIKGHWGRDAQRNKTKELIDKAIGMNPGFNAVN